MHENLERPKQMFSSYYGIIYRRTYSKEVGEGCPKNTLILCIKTKPVTVGVTVGASL